MPPWNRYRKAWYQTRAFLMFIITLAGMAAWLGYRLRLRRVARALNARFDARLEERTRVARDLHDTLLQTVQGSKIVQTAPWIAPMMRRHSRVHYSRLRVARSGRPGGTRRRQRTAHVDDRTNDLAEAFRRAIDDCRRQRAIEGT